MMCSKIYVTYLIYIQFGLDQQKILQLFTGLYFCSVVFFNFHLIYMVVKDFDPFKICSYAVVVTEKKFAV